MFSNTLTLLCISILCHTYMYIVNAKKMPNGNRKSMKLLCYCSMCCYQVNSTMVTGCALLWWQCDSPFIAVWHQKPFQESSFNFQSTNKENIASLPYISVLHRSLMIHTGKPISLQFTFTFNLFTDLGFCSNYKFGCQLILDPSCTPPPPSAKRSTFTFSHKMGQNKTGVLVRG